MAKKSGSKIRKSQSLSDELIDLEGQQMLIEMKKMQAIQKGLKNGTPLDMLRATTELTKDNKSSGDRQSYVFDPFDTSSNNGGFLEAPTNLSFSFLRNMGRTPFVRSVIGTRQNQIDKFSRPTIDPSIAGWTVRKKKSLFDDQDQDLSDKDKRIIEGVIEFIMNCGEKSSDKYSDFTRTGFDTWLRETSNDSLSMDNMATEFVENRRGDLVSFVSMDGVTARYADPTKYYDDKGRPLPDALKFGHIPKYVQIYDQRPVASFYPWEMCLGIRNKTTDIKQNGYGISELEDLVKIITWQLFGDQYNGKFFSNGAAPKGILKIAGNVNQDRLNEFRMYWKQMVSGVANAWRTPMLESDKVEWIDLQKSNQDMQFSNWAEYLIRIICAVFKIDPTEVGFVFAGGGGNGGGDPHTSHKQRTDYSKDKGLLPIFTFYENIMNRFVVPRLSDKHEFVWTGVAVQDEEEQLNNDIKQVSNWMTVNEMREKKKLPRIEGGDIILNSVFVQGLQQSMMGDMDSNDAVDEMVGSENPYDNIDFNEDDDNPFNKSALNDINSWIEQGMPQTMQQIKR